MWCLAPFFRKRVQRYCFFPNWQNFSRNIFRKTCFFWVWMTKIKANRQYTDNMSELLRKRRFWRGVEDSQLIEASRTRLEDKKETEGAIYKIGRKGLLLFTHSENFAYTPSILHCFSIDTPSKLWSIYGVCMEYPKRKDEDSPIQKTRIETWISVNNVSSMNLQLLITP